jgi:hypothetical protein
MKIIPHPTRPGFWTLHITDDNGHVTHHGAYDQREKAFAAGKRLIEQHSMFLKISNAIRGLFSRKVTL